MCMSCVCVCVYSSSGMGMGVFLFCLKQQLRPDKGHVGFTAGQLCRDQISKTNSVVFLFFLSESRVFVASCYIIKEGKGEWEARLRLRHQKDALGSTQGQGGGVNRKERNVVTGFELEALGGQERGRRRAVVSHSSPGHARANGSSQPPPPPSTPPSLPDALTAMTHMKIC